MTTGHPSKAALGAARIALLAGVSAAALSLSLAAAHAQVSVAGPTNDFLITDASGNVSGWLTGTPVTSVTATNIWGDTATITGDVGNTYAGFVATVGFDPQATAVSGLGVTGTGSGGSQTFSIDSGDGSASFASGAATIDASGNMFTTGTATVGGLLTASNGAVVTGNTTTDSLTVNQGASFAGGAAQIDGSGNIATTGSVKSGTGIDTTTINGNQAIITGTAGATYGLAVVGNTDAPGVVGVGVTGDQIGVVVANASGTATMGSSAGGTPGFRATNAAGTAGAGMNSDGISVFNASGSQFVASTDGTISAEGNRIQNVGTPIVGTDATNKAYVDKGLNKAYEGTAIALAISQPVFLPGQTFAVRGGWGDYQGQDAFGVSAAGVIARNTFGYGSTVSLDAGIGAGSSSVAGKAGVTLGFGGGSAPLK